MNNFQNSLACEIRAKLIKPENNVFQTQISTAKDVKSFFEQIWDQDSIELEERFYIAFLNRKNIITGFTLIGIGSLAAVHAEPRKILIHSLLANADSIIAAHNHPSGNLIPSSQDDILTKKIKNGCEAIGIKLLDHFIFTPDFQYYSYGENGLI